MSKLVFEKDDKILVSRREWLRLTALAGTAAAVPEAISQQLFPKEKAQSKPGATNPNQTAALWLAVTTLQNYDGNSNSFYWDRGFIKTIPVDSWVFDQVKGIVASNPRPLSDVAKAWDTFTSTSLFYRNPDVRPGITALANTKPRRMVPLTHTS